MKKFLSLSLLLFVTSCVVQNEEDEHAPNVSVEIDKSNGLVELNELDTPDKLEQLDPRKELERLNNEMSALFQIIDLPREKQAELKKIDIRAEYLRLVNEIIIINAEINWCVDFPLDEEYLKGLDEDTNEINWGDFE